jgi:hypothetical protein
MECSTTAMDQLVKRAEARTFWAQAAVNASRYAPIVGPIVGAKNAVASARSHRLFLNIFQQRMQ